MREPLWACRDAHFRAQFQASIVSIRRQGSRLKGKLGDIKMQSGDELLFDCGDNFDENSDIVKANLTLVGLVQDDHVREFMVAFEVQGNASLNCLYRPTLPVTSQARCPMCRCIEVVHRALLGNRAELLG